MSCYAACYDKAWHIKGVNVQIFPRRCERQFIGAIIGAAFTAGTICHSGHNINIAGL
jgi:hypothetical protein